MRNAFVKAFAELAKDDPRLVLVTGDLGFGVLEEFAKRSPRQFVNAGVAEQNLTGLAVGMALSGKIVFTYSIANFPTLRCLEQVRNDVCYHGANVKIVAVGGGMAYGQLGISHHATEDLAILRSLPNMTVVAPGDPVETIAATRAIARHDGPCYLRLGKAGEPTVHAGPIDFALGRAITLAEGTDVALVSTGGMLPVVVDAATRLAKQGVSARVLSMHTVKPLDVAAVERAARECRLVVSVEEHTVLGGLGGAIAEVLAELDGPRARFRRLGVPSVFTSRVGTQEWLRDAYGLSAEAVVASVERWLSR